MLKFFKRLFSGEIFGKDEEDHGWVVQNDKGVQRLSETEDAKLFQIVGVKNTCPDCGHQGFYEGPSGGMSTNIFCMNRDCRSGFNITYFARDVGICQRISQGDIARWPKEEETAA